MVQHACDRFCKSASQASRRENRACARCLPSRIPRCGVFYIRAAMPPTPAPSKTLARAFGPWLAALAALPVGCSSAGGQSAEVEQVSQALFPERFAEIWCQAVAPCCLREAIDHDSAACRAQARAKIESLFESRLRADTTYGPAAGARCLQRLEQTLSRCEIEDASNACSLVFVGPAADGSPCSQSSACQSGYCALGEVGLSGVCAQASYRAPKHGKRGEPCVGSCGVPGSFQCPSSLLPNSEGTITYCYAEDGLYCAFDSEAIDALSCQPYAVIGERCGDLSCIPGAWCAAGTCAAQQASGPCADSSERCNADSYCDLDQSCQAKKANRDACFSGEECASKSCTSDGETQGSCDSGTTLLLRACAGSL